MIVKTKDSEFLITLDTWFNDFEPVDSVLEFVFENPAEEYKVIDLILGEYTTNPLKVLFLYDVLTLYKEEGVVFIHGVGKVKTDNLQPIRSYLEMYLKNSKEDATK